VAVDAAQDAKTPAAGGHIAAARLSSTEVDDNGPALARRRMLRGTCLLTAGLLAPRAAAAAVARPRAAGRARRIDLLSTQTDEKVSVVYWDGRRYDLEALQEVDRVLRDCRTGEVRPIDPRLLDLLHDLRRAFGRREPFHVLSAYRSPQTNAWLRRQDGRVAAHSYHLDAKAADVRLPGVDSGLLLQAALELRRGGIGYYPRRDFVHVDTGPLRAW
jgi:uncharacterized protein YcbK (DUF882 family)